MKISEINKKILKIRPSSLLVKVSVMSDLTDLANKLAQIYLCKNVTNEKPCGSCKNCHLLLSGTHPDFISIFSEDSPEESIKISEINKLTSFFQLSSNQGGSRLFCLGLFEELNKTIQNSLLKVLEEPPGDLKILIFSKNFGAILPTIISRCQIITIQEPRESIATQLSERFENLDTTLAMFLEEGKNLNVSRAATACQSYNIDDVINRLLYLMNDLSLIYYNRAPYNFKKFEKNIKRPTSNQENKIKWIDAYWSILNLKRYSKQNPNKTLFLEKVFVEIKNGFN